MTKRYIGIDNGTTGWVAVLEGDGTVLCYTPTPTKRCLSYTKKKQYVSRINVDRLETLLMGYLNGGGVMVVMERPAINPLSDGGRFKTTISAARSYEATLIVLERLGLPYQVVDSRNWQSKMLPSGLAKGETKKAAVEVAKRLFPKVNTCGDADALLLAEWARRTGL